MARRRQWLIPMIVGALVTILSLLAYLSKPDFIEDISNLFTDHLQKIHPRPYDPNLPVRIVDIDDESIRRIGQWPWPRTVMAELNNRLANADAAVIAYDIIFSEADRTSPENMIGTLENNPAAQGGFANIAALKSHDSIFADSFRQTRVVTGLFLLDAETPSLPGPKYGFSTMGDSPAQSLEKYRGALYPIPELYDAAAGAGHVSFQPDGDGVVRTAPMLGRIGDQIFPSLSAEALRAVQDISTYKIKSSSASGELGHADAHESGHDQIGISPCAVGISLGGAAKRIGKIQTAGTGCDHPYSIARHIRRRQQSLQIHIGNLDAIGIDNNILSG